MSDNVKVYKKALVFLSSEHVLVKQRDSLIQQIRDEGLTKTLLILFSNDTRKSSVVTSQVISQLRAENTTPSTASVAIASNKRHRRVPSTDGQRKVQPEAVIPIPNRTRRPLQHVSQLQSRAATVSWEDGELESAALNSAVVAEESSEDELMHDTRKPAKPTGPPKVTNPSKQSSSSEPTRASKKSRLSQPVVVSNAAEPASETTTDQVAQLPPVEWVFWVQVSEEVGYWRLFSEFPNTAQVLFKCKFSTDYLQKPGHVADYARMLRSRETYRYRDVCVGNVTYWRRNEPSKRKIAEGNKEMTCDTCLNTGRFCARMVKVDGVVKLGFFPVPDAARNGVGWEKLYYWAGEKKVAKPQQSSYM